MQCWPRLPRRYQCALRLSGLAILTCALAIAADESSGDLVHPDPLQQANDGSAIQPEPPVIPQTQPVDKRAFGVLPNYRTAEDTGVYTPISAKHKLTIATKDTIDGPLFLIGGGLAGIAQVTSQHSEFGQGVKGYVHRYATAYADQAIGNYMTEGILPVLFHEDPRYFRKGAERGSKRYRIWYAATRIFVTKTDSGGTSFNFAEVVGNSIAAGVGNFYYPGETHFSDNLSRLGQNLATDSVSQVLKEFWPDVKKKFFMRHKSSAELLPPSSTLGQ